MAKKSALDKDLKKVVRLERATYSLARSLAPSGLASLFLIAVFLFTADWVTQSPLSLYVIAAGVIGGYMALNIGANDVANNMGPAVGSQALSMVAALAIAAVCEAAGAILAGGEVVATIAKNIVTPGSDMTVGDFVLVMMAALLAAASWIHLATFLNAPVSTTHSIVGGVVGSAIAAAGPTVVSWPTMASIAASWVVSPIMGGLIAALLLGFIKWTVLFRADRIAGANRWVPMLIGIMAGVFAAYLMTKGLQQVWRPDASTTVAGSLFAFAGGWALARPWVRARIHALEDRRKQIAGLFVLPLIFAAALLSFAHGANDVANAVGPLAAIVAAVESGSASAPKVSLPLPVLMIGAIGISAGLALFGPRLIRTVGEKITKMDPIRAYCVALSAAITVLAASALGLPISTTHVAVGGVFGVGFLREVLANAGIQRRMHGTMAAQRPRPAKLHPTPEMALKSQRKQETRRLVRRQHLYGIGAAWIVTIPAAGGLAALLYLGLRLIANW